MQKLCVVDVGQALDLLVQLQDCQAGPEQNRGRPLQLEQSTMATHSRIESLARERLAMELTVAFGGVADRYGNLQSYIIASLGQTALAFLFPYAGTRMELYALSALFGLFFSGAMTSFIACAREYSPPQTTGLFIGIIMFFGWVGMAVGAWQGGLFYDLCGDYFASFANASVGGVVNLLLLGLLYLYTVYRPRLVPRPV